MDSLKLFLIISIILNIFLSTKMIFVTLENEKVKDILKTLLDNQVKTIFDDFIIKKDTRKRNK